jgi:c(7)-type cytochrome triheme protein
MRSSRTSGGRRLWAAAAALLLAAATAFAAAYPAVLRVPRRDPGRLPSLPAALFSHRAHAAFNCFSCHPSTFPQALLAFTHDDMNAGRFCGRCHDGRTAFPVVGAACTRCHVAAR